MLEKTEKKVVVRVGAEALLADVQAGVHTFFIDEPVAVGGLDRGPTPYDMLLSALGSCTAITLRLYANQKKWPLEAIEVHLSHERVHRQDCDKCESPGETLEEVHKELRLLGPLTPSNCSACILLPTNAPYRRLLPVAPSGYLPQ
ncbi:OsmC family protein [Hymenobacter sp. 5414T-23]|uniref:OsmC family protein n=1 Tax=Hymenobacter sp. 5414T-23 TaxID=2932252 RepID=UPI001FD45F45|nr:OsmC family protein [Hymenobacter sp. 5414T-23]UOQ79746.1 OsmC family protein [Hymenobacter sp. 5414T-23]